MTESSLGTFPNIHYQTASNNKHSKRIYPIAREFREGIERCDKRYFPKRALDFPKGVCGRASLLLGTYLSDMGLGKSVHVSGIRLYEDWYGDHTHSWVEHNGIIVDITGDQFDHIIDPVIVTKRSSWHSSRTVCRLLEAKYRSMKNLQDIRFINLLDTIYWEIIRTIKPSMNSWEKRDQLIARNTPRPEVNGWTSLALQRVAESWRERA